MSQPKYLAVAQLIRWPNLLMLVLVQYLARIFLVGQPSDWRQHLTEAPMAFIVLSTVLVAAAGYIINDYFDVKIDLINKPDRVVVGRVVRRRVAMTAHQLLSGLGCLCALWVSKWVFLVNVLAVLLLWFYSSYLKRKPLIGNIVVATLSTLSLLILAVFYRQNVKLIALYAGFSFGITLIRELVKDIEDLRGDAEYGCATLPIVYGVRHTKTLVYSLFVLLCTVMIYESIRQQNLLLHNIFVLFCGLSVVFCVRLFRADTQKQYRFLSTFCKIMMLVGTLSMTVV